MMSFVGCAGYVGHCLLIFDGGSRYGPHAIPSIHCIIDSTIKHPHVLYHHRLNHELLHHWVHHDQFVHDLCLGLGIGRAGFWQFGLFCEVLMDRKLTRLRILEFLRLSFDGDPDGIFFRLLLIFSCSNFILF